MRGEEKRGEEKETYKEHASTPSHPESANLKSPPLPLPPSHLLQTLCALGLTYTRQRSQQQRPNPSSRYQGKSGGGNSGVHFALSDDAFDEEYSLQPNISILAQYEGYDAWSSDVRPTLPDSVKQNVAHEVRRARIRNHRSAAASVAVEAKSLSGGSGKHQQGGVGGGATSPTSPLDTSFTSSSQGGGAGDAAGRGSSAAQIAKEARDIAVAFSDEAVASSTSMAASRFLVAAGQKARQAEIRQKRLLMSIALQKKGAYGISSNDVKSQMGRYPVVYKYQEGFTNAVRRTVRLADL